mmetsp:Transcript_49962/g.142977  ORF Transcript_49962/g.142977 Transcript_49962/m.142977 type:complete len:385 (-) Transcript_49962:15-1169(-)
MDCKPPMVAEDAAPSLAGASQPCPRLRYCFCAALEGLLRLLLWPLFGRQFALGKEVIHREFKKADSVPQLQEQPAPAAVTKIVYLIRHGEAIHNVLEKAAQKRAATEAEALGHRRGSQQYAAMLEMARKAVLHDANQTDPELSEAGHGQALETREEIEQLTSTWNMPPPTRVFVSPLKRTLQTAAAVFPEHPKVQVHALVRERRTGLACDEPSPQWEMCRQKCFAHMDFGDVLAAEAAAEDVAGTVATASSEPFRRVITPETRRTRSVGSVVDQLEDAKKLRLRTARLADLLSGTEDRAVCVVTHKGYLRELERGCLGAPEATEFGTGEVRAYEVLVGPSGESGEAQLLSAEPLSRRGWRAPGLGPKDGKQSSEKEAPGRAMGA